ncbi:hypothetical protein ACLOJK_031795 [Asimina triloba]
MPVVWDIKWDPIFGRFAQVILAAYQRGVECKSWYALMLYSTLPTFLMEIMYRWTVNRASRRTRKMKFFPFDAGLSRFHPTGGMLYHTRV